MKPIRHTLTARFQNLKMYREDLDELIAKFQKACATVTISDNENRYDSIEEMAQKTHHRIKAIDIRGENPGVHCLFNQAGVLQIEYRSMMYVFNELRTEETTDAADALFREIKEFLVIYQRPSFRKGCIIGAVMGVLGIFWFAVHNSYVNKDGQTVIGSAPGVLVCFAIFLVNLIVGGSVRNYLSLQTKRNSASFFVRNREEFAKHAVTAGITTLIAGVSGYLIGHYLK